MVNQKASGMGWRPLAKEKLNEIQKTFAELFPESGHDGLADRIYAYWAEKLSFIWNNKAESIREQDLSHDPKNPLSRIVQKTVVIAYADSVFKDGEKSLATLDKFLSCHFPAI